MPFTSVLTKTRQRWKLWGGFGGQAVGLGALWFGLRDGGNTEFALIGLLFAVLTTIAPWVVIRCRSCGARWLWMAMRTQSPLGWLGWLNAQTVCPRCGDDPGVRSSFAMC
jgi:hypothetical protein